MAMTHTRSTLQILALVFALSGPLLAFGSDPPLSQLVAALDTSEFLPKQRDLTFTTLAFSSETSVEVVACTTPSRDASCSYSVVLWQNGVLKHVVESPKINTACTSSADGKRQLVDFNDRKVSKPQHVLDDIRAVWTFGMIYPEEVNREVIQVVDTMTRKSCFDWRHTFPMTGSRRRSAAISPSGEFVAIKVENSLSVYRLSSVCEGPKVTRRAYNRR